MPRIQSGMKLNLLPQPKRANIFDLFDLHSSGSKIVEDERAKRDILRELSQGQSNREKLIDRGAQIDSQSPSGMSLNLLPQSERQDGPLDQIVESLGQGWAALTNRVGAHFANVIASARRDKKQEQQAESSANSEPPSVSAIDEVDRLIKKS